MGFNKQRPSRDLEPTGTALAFLRRMLPAWQYVVDGRRDLRIDWLRGLAMTCVIINHSKISSWLSWFSYERFWVVTAAEVFVVLSGIVLGTVYGRKLVHSGWLSVVRGLSRRALTLYVAFVAVTLSVPLLSLAGIDVSSLMGQDERSPALVWLFDQRTMTTDAWRDVALMRDGPWAFQIIGLYVWLVVAAVPCLVTLHFAGWRPLLAVSWSLYVWYCITPHALTKAQFESSFPLLAWQLLFVHGIVIGYHRERLTAFVSRCPKVVSIAIGAAAAAFIVFALCNPWVEGPSWLHWSVVSPERFTYLYFNYFTLTDLRIGRVLNLAVALPIGYALLTRCWAIARPLGIVLVTLGRQSLGAFVLHVYGILLIAHIPALSDDLFINTLVQVLLIVTIAALLNGVERLPLGRARVRTVPIRSLAA
ncbi:MAG: hypothetical protein C5B57_10710 [Blastocatellia bacterium]|nr:MAG: hypothetical protein C5B57_10710 [Blastocatellia bacterium]